MKMRKVIDIYRKEGVKAVLKKIKNKFYFEEYLYKLDNYRKNKKLEYGSKFRLEELSTYFIEKMFKEYPEELSFIKYNILLGRLKENNQKAYVVLQENNICGYFNISFENVKETYANVLIVVPKDSAYLFDDYTFDKFRGMGVHKYSIEQRIKIIEAQNKKYTYVAILDGNEFSERAYLSFGFRKVKKYKCFKIFKLKKTTEVDII